MNFGNDMSQGFETFNLFFIFVGFIMLIIFIAFIYSILQGVRQNHKDNKSPRLTVNAKIVAKRADVNRRSRQKESYSHTYTLYYITFEVESGDRIELNVKDQDYGMLVEGDEGSLTFQGTRFIEFKRM